MLLVWERPDNCGYLDRVIRLNPTKLFGCTLQADNEPRFERENNEIAVNFPIQFVTGNERFDFRRVVTLESNENAV